MLWHITTSISTQLPNKNSQPSHIKQLYERCSYGKLQASVDDLRDMLFYTIEALGHVFIVVDALDECPQNGGRKQLLAVISDMKSRSLDNLHVLVTSRREPDIEEALLSLLTVPAISLQGPQVDLDIKLYISSQISGDPKLKKWPKEVKTKIENTLTGKANGMQVDTSK
jgi:ankyrin repeat domain-containing protein 50